MEHDSSRSGYHEPEPGIAGLEEAEEWGDDIVKTFSVNLIWAQASDKEGREGAIGFHGSIPWHLAEDMRRFKELTVSHPVIIGRKTWESLDPKHRPLPNRDNFVVSSDPHYEVPGATLVPDMETALDLARQEAIPDDGLDRSEIWLIGGARLFQSAMPIANRIYLTQIDVHVDADVYMPSLQELLASGRWHIIESSDWLSPKHDENGIRRYRFLTLERHQHHH